MKNLLVAQLYSRLGLANPPFGGSGEKNHGVEQAPKFLTTTLARYHRFEHVSYSFPDPENLKASQVFHEYAMHTQTAKSLILSQLKTHKTLITLGGDHSVSLASLGAILETHKPENVLILQVDSHADLHQPSTSPSGNLHGMWMRSIVDRFEDANIDRIVPHKLPTQNLVYVGNLDIQVSEQLFINTHKIQTFSAEEVRFNAKNLFKLAMDFEHVHIGLDIDAFDRTLAPASGIPAEIGLLFPDIQELLTGLAVHKSISIDLLEVNPFKPGGTKTVEFAVKLLRYLLK